MAARAANQLERRVPAHARRSGADPARRDAARQRRHRERHFRRRRRDLLQDAVLGVLLAIVMLSLIAGLGVMALIEVVAGATVLGTAVLARVLARWRSRARM